VDQKREEINLAHGLQNFHIECNETIVSVLHFIYKEKAFGHFFLVFFNKS